jgi:hypothetical protein
MDEWIRQAESWIRQQPPEQIYIAAVVVALTILLLIVGACAAKPRLQFCGRARLGSLEKHSRPPELLLVKVFFLFVLDLFHSLENKLVVDLELHI